MKFGLFLAATTSNVLAEDDTMTPWFDGDMYGQVDSESLDFGETFDDTADLFL